MQLRTRIKSELPVGKKTTSDQSKSESWVINTVYNLLVKNNWGRGEGGLIEREGLLTFFPWKEGGGGGGGREGGGAGGGGGGGLIWVGAAGLIEDLR